MAVKQVRIKPCIPEFYPQSVTHWLRLLTTAFEVIDFVAYFFNYQNTNRSSLKSESKIFLITFEFDLLSKPFSNSAENASPLAVTPLALKLVQELNWGGGLWNGAYKRLDHYIHLQLAPCPANKSWAANNNKRY